MTIVPYITPLLSNYVAEAGRAWINSQTRPTWADRERFSDTPAYIANRPRAITAGDAYHSRPKMLVRYSRKSSKYSSKKRIPSNAVTRIVRQPRVEIKASTLNNAISGPSSVTGTPTLCSVIANGTGTEQRNGSCVRFLDIDWTGTVTSVGAATANTSHRIIVFAWNQGYSSPAATQVLQTNSILSTYDVENARNYRILSDKLYNLNASAGVAGAYGPQQQYIKGYARCPMFVTFQSTSGTTADHSIWVMALADNTNGAVNINTHVRFVDV